MCNLYSITTNQAAIIALTRAIRDLTGNLPHRCPGFFRITAPIVRNAPDGVRELMLARWACRAHRSLAARQSRTYAIRKARIGAWLKPENRCVVPFNAFCEYADTKPRKTPTCSPLVKAQAARLLCWHLDQLDGQARYQSQPGRRRTSVVWIPNNGLER